MASHASTGHGQVEALRKTGVDSPLLHGLLTHVICKAIHQHASRNCDFKSLVVEVPNQNATLTLNHIHLAGDSFTPSTQSSWQIFV